MDSFSNAYETTLNGAIDNSQTSLVVTSATGKPASVPFRMRIRAEGSNTNEIVTVTNVSGTTFTVIRASEAYNGVQTASAHANGATIEHVLTAGVMSNLSGLAGIKTTELGRTTVGGSYLNMSGAYAKKITVSNTGLLANISGYVKGNNSNASSFFCFVLSDNASVPYRVIASNLYLDETTNPTFTEYIDTNARWISKPVNAYLTPGTYWIVWATGNNNGGSQLAYDSTGGTDYNHTGLYASDHSTQSYSSTAHDYSIKALFIEATASTTPAYCRSYASAAQTVSAATEFSVEFDTDESDVSGMHDTSSNTEKFYALVTGRYRLKGKVYFSGSPSGAYAYIRKNGSVSIVGSEDDDSSTSHSLNPQAIVDLVAGDYVEVRAFRSSGTSVGNATSAASNLFEMEQLPSFIPTPVGAGSRLLLDYTYAGSDYNGTSMTGGADFDVISNQTFNVVNSNSVVQFSVKSFAQAFKASGGDTSILVKILIDSSGTPISREIGGADLNGSVAISPFGGINSVYITGLSAGSHTVKVQLYPGTTSLLYLRPGSGDEFLNIQVIEHSNAGDINNGIHAGSLLYANEYRPGSDTSIATVTSTAANGVDIDATNLIFSFTSPPSGRVMVELELAAYHNTNSSFFYLLLRDGSGRVSTYDQGIQDPQNAAAVIIGRHPATFFVSGLTPGTVYNWRWGGKVTSGTTTIYGGPQFGSCVTKVWAA